MKMKLIKKKVIPLFLILSIICATPSKACAMPILIEMPDWQGWRMNTATWDCIPIAIHVAEESVKAYEARIEKVNIFVGIAGLFAGKDIVPCAGGAIGSWMLVSQKNHIKEIIERMRTCYYQRKDIKFKTNALGDGLIQYSWVGPK